MFKHENTFGAGVDRDTADLGLPANALRDLQNMRLQSMSGEGGILSTLKSNRLDFSLTDGFVPLGYATYKGVAFIFSLNPTTGEGEVGTYPSPGTNADPCAGGYERVYRPLQNWNGAVDPSTGISRLPLRTTLFNFACSNQLEVEARTSYDGSVELFFTDFRNPVRHINTGFNIDSGLCNTRMLWEGSFPNQVNVFFESCGHPVHTDVRLDTGGTLQAGNYFFYIQYVNDVLVGTSFVGEIGPVQVTADTFTAGNTLDGDEELEDTGRAVEIDLSNIDTTFPYIRVATVLYTGAATFTGLVTTLFPITPGQTTLTIRITGTEELSDITIAEISRRKGLDDCAKSMTQRDDMLLLANLKERDVPYQDLRDLGQLFIAKPPDAVDLEEVPMNRVFQSGVDYPFGNKDADITLERNGYFRAETYAFALVLVFKDGKESLPYPVKGYDAWFDPTVTTLNTKGILRFPSNMDAGYALYQNNGTDWVGKAMAVRFDHLGVAVPDWVTEQACGFYFVRAERKPNLVYQGHIANAYRGASIPASYASSNDQYLDPNGSTSVTFGQEQRSAYDIAEFSYRNIGTFTGQLALPVEMHNAESYPLGIIPVAPTPERFGLFSSDHFFKQILPDRIYTIVKQGQGSLYESGMGGPNTSYYPDFYWDQQAFLPEPTLVVGAAKLTNLAPRNYGQSDGFTTGFEWGDDTTVGGPVFYYGVDDPSSSDPKELGNRRMLQRNYIGLAFNDVSGVAIPGTTQIPIEDDVAINPNGPAVVNVYRADPRPVSSGGNYDITTLYDPAFSLYFRISEFIPVTEWANIPSMLFYKGDCFLQRTYHRHLHEGGFHGEDESSQNRYYKYGNIAGMVQECTINTAMRFETGTADSDQRYYPEKSPNNPIQFAAQFTGTDESRNLNAGYDHMLGVYSVLGDDIANPLTGGRYPVRVKHCHKYVNEQAQDGYLQWDLDAKRDYNHHLGPINRIITRAQLTVIVQDKGISPLNINREAILSQEASEGQLLIGSGGVLPEKAAVISSGFGSQHQWSIGKTDRAIYGYDQDRRKFWRIGSEGLDILSDRKRFVRDTMAVSQQFTTQSDVLSTYEDHAVCGSGVVFYADPKFKEVGWSFMLYTPPEDQVVPWPFSYRTLAYNEEMDAYMAARTHHSPFYLLLNEDLFATDPRQFPQTTATPQVGFWMQDADEQDRLKFFTVQQTAMAAWVANPMSSQPKVFMDLWLSSTDEIPTTLSGDTEFQSYLMDPFLSTAVEETPEYRENRWKLPVIRSQAVSVGGSQEYEIGSEMRGEYLRVAVTWNSARPVNFSCATTLFQPSLQ